MKPEWIEKLLAPDPATVVDRLRGIYPSAVGVYAVSRLQKEAADEIEFLHNLIAKFNINIDEFRSNQS